MSSEIEAAGDLATAALVGGVIEKPEAGAEPAKAGVCANCGAALEGPFCSACGQRAGIRRTLAGMAEELIYNLVHLDGRIWRTIPLLVYRPGKLTHDYVHGQRTFYVSPLALFLFFVFAMFFVFELSGGTRFGVPEEEVQEALTQVIEDEDVPQETRDMLQARLDAGGDLSPAEIGELVTEALRQAETAREAALEAEEAQAEQAEALEDAPPAETGGPGAADVEVADDGTVTVSDEGSWDINLGNAALEARLERAFENPEFTFYRIQNTVPKYSFLLAPLSLPFVWLLFAWRRDLTLFDHTVFILYSLSFMALMFLCIGLISLVSGALAGMLTPVWMLAPPIHIYKHLKGAYGLGRFGAGWRTIFLLWAALIVLIIYSVAMLLVGVLG